MRKKSEARLLKLHVGLVDKHDRQPVANRIHSVALRTLQALGVLAVLEFSLAGRANQHFKKVSRQHNLGIIRGPGKRNKEVSAKPEAGSPKPEARSPKP